MRRTKLKTRARAESKSAYTATVSNRHHRGHPHKFRSLTVYFIPPGANATQADIINRAKWGYTRRYIEEALGLEPTRSNIKIYLDKFDRDRSLDVGDIMEL